MTKPKGRQLNCAMRNSDTDPDKRVVTLPYLLTVKEENFKLPLEQFEAKIDTALEETKQELLADALREYRRRIQNKKVEYTRTHVLTDM